MNNIGVQVVYGAEVVAGGRGGGGGSSLSKCSIVERGVNTETHCSNISLISNQFYILINVYKDITRVYPRMK